MPIMDRLYGFRDFKTVMRAQVVHNCVNEGNANVVTISNKFIGYLSFWETNCHFPVSFF